MFVLSQLEHRLRLPPMKLDIPLEEGIKGELEINFLDKVIPKLGLCVSVYDIQSIDGGFVVPNDGAPTYTVVFRLIMFKPYVGEVLTGKLRESDTTGIKLTLGFFDDINIPSYALPDPSSFEPNPQTPKENRWVWTYEEGGTFYIEKDDEIRFRVTHVRYPPIPLEQEDGSKPFAPMEVTGAINMEGLGPVKWWF